MRALTIHRPWAWAIAWGGKRVENRSWYPKFLAGETQWDGFVPALPGTRIAIHAGARWVSHMGDYPEHARAWAAATARQVLAADDFQGLMRRQKQRGIVAVAELVGFAPEAPPMASGPWYIPGTAWAWILGEVWPLQTPIPCKGRQRLWKLDAETLRRVEEQVDQ